MSGLADELLADLDDLSDSEEYVQKSSKNGLKRVATEDADAVMSDEDGEPANDNETVGLVLEGGVRPTDELHKEDVQQMDLGGIADVTNIAKLEGSRRMIEILKVRL